MFFAFSKTLGIMLLPINFLIVLGLLGALLLLTRWGRLGRTLLVAVAAKRWGVDPTTCRAQHGVVSDATGSRRLSYGQLVDAAAALPVPARGRACRSSHTFVTRGPVPAGSGLRLTRCHTGSAVLHRLVCLLMDHASND